MRDNEVWLVGAEISEYAQGNIARTTSPPGRKLLLKRGEIAELVGKVREKGQTIVPTRLYFKDGRVKIEIALARGRERATSGARSSTATPSGRSTALKSRR